MSGYPLGSPELREQIRAKVEEDAHRRRLIDWYGPVMGRELFELTR